MKDLSYYTLWKVPHRRYRIWMSSSNNCVDSVRHNTSAYLLKHFVVHSEQDMGRFRSCLHRVSIRLGMLLTETIDALTWIGWFSSLPVVQSIARSCKGDIKQSCGSWMWILRKCWPTFGEEEYARCVGKKHDNRTLARLWRVHVARYKQSCAVNPEARMSHLTARTPCYLPWTS